MKDFPQADFEVKWVPYLLNPRAPRAGSEKDPEGIGHAVKLDSYAKRMGEQQANAMVENMKKVGKDVGINFSYGGRTGGSFDSHRVLSLARKQGGEKMVDTLMEVLFKNYFEEEKYVGNHEVLQAAADKVGLKVNVKEFLASEEEIQQTVEDIQAAQTQLNIQGVPHFVVGGGKAEKMYQFGGAQDTEVFKKLFGALLDGADVSKL